MGGWHTNRPVVVGKYSQTRQRWLRVKTVKSSHGRHYKEILAVNSEGGITTIGGTITKE